MASGIADGNDADQICRRRPPSVFDALMSLTPPSPVLAPSVMRSSWTSEEVPVFLFDSENEDVTSRRYSMRPTFHALDLPSSSSFDTIQTTHTTGTFGQFKEIQRFQERVPASIQTIVSTKGLKEISSEPGPDTVSCDTSSILESYFDAQAMSSSSQTPSPSPSVYSTFSCSSLSSQYRLDSKLRPIDHSNYAEVLCSPSRMTILSSSRRNSSLSLPTVSQVNQLNHHQKPSDVPNSSHSAHATRISLTSVPMSSQIMQIPKSLTWLTDTVVEILIDQEGFRSINPTFKFVGYSANIQSVDLKGDFDGGVAHFMPTTRQTFHFHYAIFESQPMLRRVSVNGNNRDHISRQAIINLKSNGVYTVCGAETSLLSSVQDGDIGHISEASTLRWKFDYFVDDREGSKIAEGEKTFTPLTFTCSPLLLHPLQGKKVRLVHVVRKSLITKLVAEKVEPPIPGLLNRPSSPPVPTPLSGERSQMGSPKTHFWNRHQRVHSHELTSDGKHNKYDASPIQILPPSGHYQVNEELPALQQQIQSLDKQYQVPASEQDAWAGGSLARRSLPASRDVSHFMKHIVAPSKLSELLNNDEPPLRLLEGTCGLSPAPRSQRKMVL